MNKESKKIHIMHLRSSGGLFGAEGVILNLSKDMDKEKYENYIVCINNAKNPHTEILGEATKFGLRAFSVMCNSRFDIKAILEIRKMLKKHKIDILHMHDYKANLFGFLASRFLNVRLVTTLHLWTSETPALRFYEFLDALLINAFDRIIAVSEKIAKDARRLCINKNKIKTIHNGVDLDKYSFNANGKRIREEFNIHPKSRIVGSIGRLTNQKGFDYLLEAASNILEGLCNVKFLIVGNGVMDGELRQKAKNLGIQDNVIFAGNRKDMVDIYNSLDVFVLPSIKEGLPLVVLEALAMKRPVVATNVGGVSTVIHKDKTGVLIEPENVTSLAKSITGLLNDKKKSDFLATNGRQFIEDHFSTKIMAKKYQDEYINCIFNRRNEN